MPFPGTVSNTPTEPGVESPAPAPDGFQAVRVLQVVAAGTDAMLVSVTAPRGFAFRPAQVVELASDPSDINYFAIASGLDETAISFLIKRSSPPAPIDSVRAGDRLWLRGPWGKGFDLDPGAPLVLCGIGSAVGALRSALVTALQRGFEPDRITLLVGLRHFAALPNPGEVLAWTQAGVRVVLALSSPGARDHEDAAAVRAEVVFGRITNCLHHHIKNGDAVLLAGSEAAEDDVIRCLAVEGIAPASVQRNFRPDHRDSAV